MKVWEIERIIPVAGCYELILKPDEDYRALRVGTVVQSINEMFKIVDTIKINNHFSILVRSLSNNFCLSTGDSIFYLYPQDTNIK